jgi:hypothetical protein
MTTFQDQPPQSRRAVRQSERDGATGAQVASGDVPVTPPQPSFVQQPAPTQPAAPQQSGAPQQPVAPETAAPQQPGTSQPVAPQQAGVPQQAQSHAAPPVTGRRSRAAAPSGLVDMPTTPPYPGSEPLTYATQGAPGAQQPPQPAASQQTGEQPPFRVRDFSPEAGRRAPAPRPNTPAPDAAPLDYRTQAGPAVAAAASPAQAAPVAPAAPSPNPPVSLTPTGTPITASGTPLTEGNAAAAGNPVTATGTPVTATGTPEVAMTRRELRAQQAERDAAAARASGTLDVPPLVEPAAPTSTLSTAMAEFEALTRAAQGVSAPVPAAESPADRVEAETSGRPANDDGAATAVAQAAAAASAAAAAAEQQRAREAAAAAQAAAQAEAANRAREEATRQAELTAQRAFDAEQATRARQAEAAQAAHEQAARALQPQPSATTAAAPQNVEQPFDPLAAILASGAPPVASPAGSVPAPAAQAPLPAPTAAAPQPPAAPVLDPLNPAFIAPDTHQTGSHATSTGHWSRQAELDDETQPNVNPLSRDVGGGNVATTTSALVLPSIPAPVDFGTIINGTGEILVTGSIELPRSLSSTGGDQRRYDDPDVDNLFDAFDNEIISTDSAPVRAIRAVSTHTSTHGVIANNKPKNGNRMLVILLGSTVVLAIAVVGLLAVAANLLP